MLPLVYSKGITALNPNARFGLHLQSTHGNFVSFPIHDRTQNMFPNRDFQNLVFKKYKILNPYTSGQTLIPA